jgi:hypothetical protein
LRAQLQDAEAKVGELDEERRRTEEEIAAIERELEKLT